MCAIGASNAHKATYVQEVELDARGGKLELTALFVCFAKLWAYSLSLGKGLRILG